MQKTRQIDIHILTLSRHGGVVEERSPCVGETSVGTDLSR